MKNYLNKNYFTRQNLKNSIEKCDLEKVRSIVENHGTELLENYNNFSPLHVVTIEFKKGDLAHKQNMIEIIKYLVRQNPESINYKDSTGCTPFAELLKNVANSYKITQDMIDLLKEFIGNGADIAINAEYVEVSWMNSLEKYIQDICNNELTACFQNAYISAALSGNYPAINQDFDF